MKRKLIPLPSKERLNELFTYNQHTGELFWKVKRGPNGKVGKKAGGFDCGSGYMTVGIDRARYLVHRICYKIATGRDIGELEIDHINGIKTDNRLLNLRAVSSKINQRNKRRNSKNTSGYTGVSFFKRTKKWRAYIQVKEKQIHLGFFENLEDAVAARAAANIKYGYHSNHGRAT